MHTATIEQLGDGDADWAVLVGGEVELFGLTKSEAERRSRHVNIWASAAYRDAARERIAGEFLD